MRLSFDLAKAFSSAFGAFGDSFSAHMDGYVQLMGLGFKFRLAVGADIRFGHEYDVSENGYQQNGNGNVIPRNVKSIAKPIHLTG